MPNELIEQITDQPQDELQAIVSQILEQEATPTGALTATKIGRSAGHATAGIFRVTGHAQVQNRETEWSAVVKALGTPEHPSPGTGYDALGEVDIYRSRAFAERCGGIRGARCYAIQPRHHLQLLWLEDLSGAPQAPWELHQFITTARHLGQFNAHWPEDALPQWEWFSRRSFRADFTRNSGFQAIYEQLPAQQEHPFIQALAPGAELQTLIQMWDECDGLLQQAERGPIGVCHMDCHPKNLFPMPNGDNDSYTIAIDWVKVGASNLGIDIGHLLASPISWLEVTPKEAMTLRQPILDAYLSGLADAGWSGNEEGVRLSYFTRLACEALRSTVVITAAIDNAEWRAAVERTIMPVIEFSTRLRAAREFFLDCREDALRLAQRLNREI